MTTAYYLPDGTVEYQFSNDLESQVEFLGGLIETHLGGQARDLFDEIISKSRTVYYDEAIELLEEKRDNVNA